MKYKITSPSDRPEQGLAPDSHDQISAHARKIWEEKGRPEGRDVEIWFEAERRLKSAATSPREERAFADPSHLLNRDNDPSSRLEDRLREAAAQPERRSATSL